MLLFRCLIYLNCLAGCKPGFLRLGRVFAIHVGDPDFGSGPERLRLLSVCGSVTRISKSDCPEPKKVAAYYNNAGMFFVLDLHENVILYVVKPSF